MLTALLAFAALVSTAGFQEPPPDAARQAPPPGGQQPPASSGSTRVPPLQKDQEGISYYPMPSFASDKDSGVTYGVLLGVMFTNSAGVQDALLSGSVTYQHLVKWGAEVEFRYNPEVWSTIDLDGYVAERVESSLRLFYEDFKALGNYHARFEYFDFRSSTDRFFGVGDDNPRSAEAVRTSNEYRTEGRFGPQLGAGWDVEGTIRWRKFRVGDSLITDLPQMTAVYPQQPGIEGGSVVAGGIRFVHDSRDVPSTPSSGVFANFYFERAEYLAPTQSDPYWTSGASVVTILPMDQDKQFVTALNVATQVVVGDRIPFWELPALGGATTLRSFNGARFMNKGSILFNVEERIRVYRTGLFDVNGEVQIAPFLDVGKVYDSMDDLFGRGIFQSFHYSAGVGFRGVVAPSFVGRLDIAVGGGEGVGVIIGLDYPY